MAMKWSRDLLEPSFTYEAILRIWSTDMPRKGFQKIMLSKSFDAEAFAGYVMQSFSSNKKHNPKIIVV